MKFGTRANYRSAEVTELLNLYCNVATLDMTPVDVPAQWTKNWLPASVFTTQ